MGKNNKEEKKEENTSGTSEDVQVTPPAPEKPKKDDGKVEVDKSVLEQILVNQKRQEDLIKNQATTIDMLKQISDKGRLAKYEEQNRGQLIRRANVGTWDGKVILGWVSVKDEVGVINGVLRETQIVKLYLDEGPGKELSNVEVEYLHWYRNVGRLYGDVVRESRTTNGETRTLKLEDGREFELDIRFLNI